MMVFSGMRLVGVADKSFFAGQKRAGKNRVFFPKSSTFYTA
jgi:hypothetical protein